MEGHFQFAIAIAPEFYLLLNSRISGSSLFDKDSFQYIMLHPSALLLLCFNHRTILHLLREFDLLHFEGKRVYELI